MKLRRDVYELGRRNFCELRSLSKKSNGRLPLYHTNFITRIDKEDRNILYTYIGNVIKRYRDSKKNFKQSDFNIIFSICVQDRSGHLMNMFMERYSKTFEDLDIKIDEYYDMKKGNMLLYKRTKTRKKRSKTPSRKETTRKKSRRSRTKTPSKRSKRSVKEEEEEGIMGCLIL